MRIITFLADFILGDKLRNTSQPYSLHNSSFVEKNHEQMADEKSHRILWSVRARKTLHTLTQRYVSPKSSYSLQKGVEEPLSI